MSQQQSQFPELRREFPLIVAIIILGVIIFYMIYYVNIRDNILEFVVINRTPEFHEAWVIGPILIIIMQFFYNLSTLTNVYVIPTYNRNI